jgi:protein-S-isoprenylcysteine O-methyltransferase Ste14
MYLGMTLILIGAGIIMGSVTAFIGAIFFIVAMEMFFIPDEEKIMLEVFDEKFKNYK